MERIQSAIEKARKSRNKEDQEAATEPNQKASQTRPASKPAAEGDLQKDETLASRWKSIPAMQLDTKSLDRNRILAYRSSPGVAAYDMMRTKLLQQMRKNQWRRVAITSASPGSGKTMTSLNLAFSLSRQSDLRIMLIELDMRRPAMAQAIGVRPSKLQFSEALADRDPAEKHMIRYGSNVIFAVNNHSIRDSAEMLQGLTASRVLDDIEKRYEPDIMIFDMPPMTSSDDTLAFLDQIDCALLMVEAEKNRPNDIEKCEQELAARTNVLGVVLNKCRYLDRTETYGYYDAT